MEPQRGRSPSARARNGIKQSLSPSPHEPFRYASTIPNASNADAHGNLADAKAIHQYSEVDIPSGQSWAPGVDPSLLGNGQETFSEAYHKKALSTNQVPYPISTALPDDDSPEQQLHQPLDVANNRFVQSQSFHPDPSLNPVEPHNFSSGFLPLNPTSGEYQDFGDPFFHGNNFGLDQSIDPSLLVDPQLLDAQSLGQTSVDPSELFNEMAAAHQSHILTPRLPMSHGSRPSRSSSPHVSQDSFSPSQHLRHQSLDPASAAHSRGYMGGEWSGMQFVGHRRTPSDTHSDISSAHVSPYLGNLDQFDIAEQSSPLLQPQPDSAMFQDALGLGQFSISDLQAQHRHFTPAHSPHVSPRLAPQQPLPDFTSANNYGMSINLNDQLNNQFANMLPPDMYLGSTAFPQLSHSNSGSAELGQADQMSPPEINIDFAPPTRQASFDPPETVPGQGNALSPPERSRSRVRIRAKSDPFDYSGSRPSTPSPCASPSLVGVETADSLSPLNLLSPRNSSSRSPSPSARSDRPYSRRSSTSAVPNHAHLLDVADPSQPSHGPTSSPASTGSGPTRVQKHPATFQCTLCPKRFTRAYNLRSHLRTHTDERPFVCTICGKAFARQHDRKRHEGLHSGEKKFVCRGKLKGGVGAWGCGRRFARADALGRHFRSEAGRVCIAPLLEEERAERERAWREQLAQQQQQSQAMLFAHQQQQQQQQDIAEMAHMQAAQQLRMQDEPQLDLSALDPNSANYTLPAALLAQYPALAGFNWADFPLDGRDGDGDLDLEFDGDEGDMGEIGDAAGGVSGRSSFEGSGGEWGDDEGVVGVGVGEGGFGAGGGSMWGAEGRQWGSDYEGER